MEVRAGAAYHHRSVPERAAAGGRGLLTLLRAAAIVIIATGLNDVIAGAVPSYEPLYLYLAAVALVALLDGIVAATLTAVLAVAFYALLFMPRVEVLSPRLAIPAAFALGTAVVMSTVRALWRRMYRRRVEPEPMATAAAPMLPPPQILTLDSSEILLAIDSLRADLRGAVAEAAAARDREALARDREAMLDRSYSQAREALAGRLHIAEEETKRLLEAVAEERVRRSQAELALGERKAAVDQLTLAERQASEALRLGREESARQLDASRKEAAALKARVGALESAVAAAESVRRQTASLQHELENARAEASAHATEAAAHANEAAAQAAELQALRHKYEELRRALEIEKGRSEGERGIRTTAVERVKELERTLRVEREAREREQEGLRIRLLETEQTNAELQQTATSATTLNARIRELEQSLAEERQARSAAQSELVRAQRSVKEAESARGSRETELALVRKTLAELQASSERQRIEHAEALAELGRELAAADDEIEAKSIELTARQQAEAELRARVDEIEAARGADRREADERLATLAAHLAEDHETDLGRIVEEREAARAELRAAKIQIEERRRASEESVREVEARTLELQGHLDETRATLERERTERAAERVTFDEKLSTIAAHLAEDHEADLGRIVEEREFARAELRAANLRITALEESLQKASAETVVKEESDSTLQVRIAELEASLEEERHRFEKANDEFDEKLTTIVSHLANDHESDLGKALEEKEAARAEARSLSLRIASLQKKVEDDRTALVDRLREAEELRQQAIEDSTRILSETRKAAQAEIDRLRQRIGELEGRPATPPVVVPAPLASSAPTSAKSAKPLVLVAHADAEMRMSARVSLEKAGYEIIGAADGLEALRTATAIQPDVVIADAVLPKMGGRELCQLLKSQEKTAGIRVVLLTRAVDTPPHGDFPPDEVLSKPVPLENLKATLAGLLAPKA